MSKHQNDSVLLFRTQLSLILFPLIILPIVGIGFFSYNASYAALRIRSTANVDRIAALANQNLDANIQRIIQLAQTPMYDQDIQQIVSYYATHPDITTPGLQDKAKMQDFFTFRIIAPSNAIASVDVCTMGNVSFSETINSLPSISNWKTQPWFRTVTTNVARTVILPTRTIRPDMYLPNFQYPSSVQFPSLFSLVETIENVRTFQIIGAIVITIDAQNIKQTIDSSQGSTATQFVIYDAQHKLIYSTDPALGQSENSLQAIQQKVQQGKRNFTWNNNDYFLSSNTSSLSQWTVVALVPTVSLTQDIEPIKQTTIFIICITLLLTTSLFFFSISRMSTHVTHLRRLMKQVEAGNLDVRFQSRGRGELTTLGQSFNLMVIRLKRSIQDTYESQLQQQKAELAALQSQINPHFLYNTLASFQMIATTEGSERVARMSYMLGQVMSYSLEKDELVRLGHALEHINNFLLLMQEQYEERLQFTIRIPESLYAYEVPKFMLQPLVENAIYHGIDPKVEAGLIEIVGSQQDDALIIEILDNGVGMPQRDLERLQTALRYEANILKRSRHIGILNVQGQLQRIFGAEYGLSLAPRASGGLSVTIRLPLSLLEQERVGEVKAQEEER